jgi:hypothetical protein
MPRIGERMVADLREGSRMKDVFLRLAQSMTVVAAAGRGTPGS